MEETSLIKKAESYLNKIANKRIDLSNVSKLDNFINIYQSFTQSLDILVEMKSDMEMRGYMSPYSSLTKYGAPMSNEIHYDELAEISRHGQSVRRGATAKKIILDRIKSAIDSHKIAMAHLEEYAVINCNGCHNEYKLSEFLSLKEKKCNCDGSNFSISPNQYTVYRLDIIPYLPLSGNYMVLRAQLSHWGRKAYTKIVNSLSKKKKAVVKTVSLTIKYNKDGRWLTKNLNLDSDYVDLYEEKIKELYGKDAKILRLNFNHSNPSIINDKHTITALALAYSQLSQEIVKKNSSSILKENISDYNSLKSYDNIIFSIKNEQPHFIVDENSLEEWRDLKIKDSLKDKGLMDKSFKLNPKLKKDLYSREQLENKIFSEIGNVLILWDIFKYYLITSNDRRKRYKGLFPYLRGDIDRTQREVFANYNPKTIDLLVKYEYEKILKIKDMDLILFEKFKLEKKIKGLNMNFNYLFLGAALISLNSTLDCEIIEENFNINSEKVKKGIEDINMINQPRSDKSKKFLGLVSNF
ncbi:MAG: DUF530 domain-containing protein [Methanobrevibacter sp.]|jgi:Zn-finger domain-containing protein|nr:DUF530 domain-containing protein [Methanobrevibacter sp.]